MKPLVRLQWYANRGQARYCPPGLILVLLLSLLLALAWLSPAGATDGALDPSFDPGAGVTQIPIIRGKVDYTDGTNRWLIYGYFTSMKGQARNSIARFNGNGTLDSTFNPPVNGEVRTVALVNNDKILIGGKFTAGGYPNPAYYNLARLNDDGTLDTTFYQALDWFGAVNSIGLQSTGKFLVGGYSLAVYGDTTTYHLLRCNAGGSVDNSFTKRSAPEGYVNNLHIITDDPEWIDWANVYGTLPNPGSLTDYLLFVDKDGVKKGSYNETMVNGPIFDSAYQIDGTVEKGVYVGQFTQVYNPATSSWVSRRRIFRLGGDGNLDLSFDPGTGANSRVSSLVVQGDKIVIAGNFDQFNGTPVGYVTRLQTNGAIDPTFNPGTGADTRIFHLDPNLNGVILYGAFRSVNGTPRAGVAVLDSTGALTNAYSSLTNDNTKKAYVYALAVQADGKVLAGGDFTGVRGKYRPSLARFNPDGTLDTGFTGGVDGTIQSLALQSDGKILAAGEFGQANGFGRTSLARFTSTNSLDTAFNPIVTKLDGSVSELYRVVVQNNGQLLIGGHFRKVNGTDRTQVARLNADGSLDAGFNSQITIADGTGIVPNAVLPTAGGKYVVAGYVTYQSLARGFLCRLNTDGTLDNTFGPPGPAPNPSPNVVIPAGQVYDLGLQSDGRIMIVGSFSEIKDGSFSPPQRGGIARFTADGALDNTFTTNIGANNMVTCLAIQPDGKFLIGGYFKRYNDPVVSDPDNALRIARVLPNGDRDTTFKSVPGANDALWALTLLPGGKKAYIGGQFTTFDGASRAGIARIITGSVYSPAAVTLLLLED
jgi:uncharacterized delta-60 repeat protein